MADFEHSKRILERHGFRVVKGYIFHRIIPMDSSFSIGTLNENGTVGYNTFSRHDPNIKKYQEYQDRIKALGIV